MTKTRKWLVISVSVSVLLALGFAAGFVSSIRLRRPGESERMARVTAQEQGDAPAQIRAGVLDSLRAFQAGYVKRDPAQISEFMSGLFPHDDQILLIGTQAGTEEWAHGYAAASRFIERDWRLWGDLRFDAERGGVWSSGDAAWVVSTGTVQSDRGSQQVRFTAVLTRVNDRWRFRQIHFQLVENQPDERDVLNPRLYLRIAHLALRDMLTRAQQWTDHGEPFNSPSNVSGGA